MSRCIIIVAILSAVTASAHADSFDHYLNPILAKIPDSKSAEKLTRLTADAMIDHARVLPGISAAFVVVKTNEGRWAKLLVQPARHKITATTSAPIVLVERLVTFREGEERAVAARAENVRLFHDFRLNLDIGQIVPAALGGDLRLVAEGDSVHLEPVGKAELYLVKKHLPEATPKKGARLIVGAKFEPSYFNGVYKLYDDGRRSGTLHLKVGANNFVSGHYYSDKDGAKYDVEGKVGNPNHSIQFSIIFPRTMQQYAGCLFTGDAKAIAGFSRLQERETGFYAVRVEE
ncbi:MAG: hypothetical protein L0Y71_01470 [Gemmataceae bacterium]|nr:hypothetical protein [Gemmataceae bacterium]